MRWGVKEKFEFHLFLTLLLKKNGESLNICGLVEGAIFLVFLGLWMFKADEKDIKIRELTAELQRERKRCAAFQEQLDMVLRDMEEHSNHLSRNIDGIVQSVREIESKKIVHSQSK
ncbi:hypothetical protein CK203_000037 [Vitis vinifera]|uniref:Uncharacterized protein n=1 Tax=Vitis vinifera TaxID=29760 RepID=A0A438KQW7_VITVI|nr:hypothetical protein CK203_000037 [Vitis vinifera]